MLLKLPELKQNKDILSLYPLAKRAIMFLTQKNAEENSISIQKEERIRK